jgi:hypothetical protein
MTTLWSSIQRVVAPPSDADDDDDAAAAAAAAAMSSTTHRFVDSDDERDVDDVTRLKADLRLEQRNSAQLSAALDAERDKHREEVRQLRELLLDKESELEQAALDAKQISDVVAKPIVTTVVKSSSSRRHDAFLHSLARLLNATLPPAPLTDVDNSTTSSRNGSWMAHDDDDDTADGRHAALLAALERVLADRSAADRSAELKQRNDTLTRQLKEAMPKLKLCAELQTQLDAARAAEAKRAADAASMAQRLAAAESEREQLRSAVDAEQARVRGAAADEQAQLRDARERAEALAARVSALESELATRVRGAADDDAHAAERSRRAVADAEERCATAERALERQRADADELRRQLERATVDVVESREREKQNESESMMLRQELQQSRREAERLRAHLLEKEDAEALLTGELETVKRVADAADAHARALADAEAQCDELRLVAADKDNEVTLLSKAVMDLQTALESLQTETAMNLQAELGAMATRLALANGRVAALESLEQRHAAVQDECDALQARFNAQTDELARAHADAQRAIEDASTLQYTVEKLVAQVDMLSQNEIRMMGRDRVKQLVLQICAGGSSRRSALEAIASACQMSVDEKKQVGLISSSWLEAAGLVSAPAAAASAATPDAGLANTFVAFLENSVLEEQVNELQLEEEREKRRDKQQQQGRAADL